MKHDLVVPPQNAVSKVWASHWRPRCTSQCMWQFCSDHCCSAWFLTTP